MARAVNFRSKAAYRRWLAYAKMHAKPGKHPLRVKIKGKVHKVKHTSR